MGEIYFKGLFSTITIARFMDGAISENQIGFFKECITRYWERKIDGLPLSDQEKEEHKHQMKQSTNAYNHGIKDGV